MRLGRAQPFSPRFTRPLYEPVDIVAAGSVSITGSALLTGTGSLVAAGTLSITGAADLDATGSLAAAGSLSITGSAVLASPGDVEAAGSLSITGAAVLNAAGSLLSAGSLSITGAADLTGASLSDIAATGSVSITGAASLTAIGNIIALGNISITGAAALTSNLVATSETNVGGWLEVFRTEQERIKQRNKRRKEAQAAEKQEDKINAEIASILHKQEQEEENRVDLARLKALVKKYSDAIQSEANSDRILKALKSAQEKQTIASMEALSREIAKAQEEEEMLLMMLLA